MKHLALILIFFSCSPIARHSRIVRKYPFVHTTDSVKIIDTIKLTTNKVVSDTVVQESLLFDTITLTKENLTVSVLKIKDSIYINGKCDTVFIDKIVERTIPIKFYAKEKRSYLMIVVFLLFLLFMMLFTKR